MSENSKLPWTIKWQHEGGVTVGTEEHPLIEISNIGIGHEAATELAEQVMREHNAYPAMMDALREQCKSCDVVKEGMGITFDCEDCKTKVAIKAAGKE